MGYKVLVEGKGWYRPGAARALAALGFKVHWDVTQGLTKTPAPLPPPPPETRTPYKED